MWSAIVIAVLTWPTNDKRWLLVATVPLLGVIAASADLYWRFARVRGLGFALSAIPLHLLYYVTNGVSVCLGWLMHHAVGEPRPDPVVEAYAEVGVQRDPPLPSRRRGGPWAETVGR